MVTKDPKTTSKEIQGEPQVQGQGPKGAQWKIKQETPNNNIKSQHWNLPKCIFKSTKFLG